MNAGAGFRVAMGAALLSAVVLALALTRGLHVASTVPVAAAPVVPTLGPPFPAGAAIPDDAALTLAADHNPFHPERRRGGTYQLPGSEVEPKPQEMVAAAAGAVTLVGTAVSEGGRSFVVCRVGHESPRIVRLEGSCGDLVLDAVEQGRASFMDPAGDRVVLEVPKVGTD